jgi:CHAT domain-containing protein/Tfp pilus assembly protein PilF
MKFPCYTVLSFLFFASIAIGQDVSSSYDTGPKFSHFFLHPSDSITVSSLLRTADSISAVSIDSMKFYVDKAYSLTTDNIGWADHPLLDSCYYFISALHLNKGQFKESIKYIDSALTMSIRLYPGGHESTIEFYYHRSLLASREKYDSDAHEYISAARYMARNLGLADSTASTQVFQVSGWMALYAGDFETADSCFTHAQKLTRRSLPEQSVAMGDYLSELAYAYNAMYRSNDAIDFFEASLSAYRADSSTSVKTLLESLQATASHHARVGTFSKAATLFQEAEQRYRSEDHKDDNAFAWFLLELGEFYLEIGKYSDAERVLFEAYDLYVALNKPDDFVWAPITIAKYYTNIGLHAEAEPYYHEACSLALTIYGETSGQYAMTMKNLGDYYLHRGRYKEARAVFKDRYAYLESTGPDAAIPRIHTALSLAFANENLGMNDAADALYLAALEEATATYGEGDLELAVVFNNIGQRYKRAGNHAEAGVYIQRAADIYRSSYKLPHPKLATALNNLAKHYHDTGVADSAEHLFEEALDMRRKLFTNPHPDILNSLLHYGEFLATHDRVEEATTHFRELLDGLYQRMDESFEFESEGKQLDFLSNIVRPSLNALSRFCLANATKYPTLAELLLSATMRLKGAIANESAVRQLQLSKSKQVIELNTELTELREQQAALSSRTNSPEVHKERTRIRNDAERLETAIRRLDRRYDKIAVLRAGDWKDLQRVLKKDEAIVEYFAVPNSNDLKDPNQTYHYAAIILRHTGVPVITRTCSQKQLKQFFIAKVDLRNMDSYVMNPVQGGELFNLVWKPVESLLNDVNTVYIVPDGELHRISFAALPSGIPTKPYLDNTLSIRFLTHSKQLLARTRKFAIPPVHEPKTFLLIGDPDFAAAKSAQPGAITARRYKKGWSELPGTRLELSLIASTCEEKNIPHTVLAGKDATEDTLKSFADDPPRVLHIATHGFFFAGIELERITLERLRSTNRGGNQLRIINNPMLRSGLLLTGANAVWTGEVPAASSNDGILTALEVSRLNLIGTELVTLSACETGLGDVLNGEGIFGLQRAFQVAGAGAVIMSLWKVADEPTAILMKTFYSAWLSGTSKTEAFRIARSQLRELYPSPFYWAAFVLVGE